MKKNKGTKQKIILGIILIAVVILCGIYVQINSKTIYDNINIDASKLNIFYFNVGQADSILIIYEDKTMLIDAGNDSDGEEILKFLRAKGVGKIDYLIGTHIHEDHIGGIADIVDNLTVNHIFMPYNENTNSNFYNKVKNSISNKSMFIETIKEKDEFYLTDDVLFKILYVDNSEPSNINNESIVIQLEYKTQKYLFMGDSEKEVEDKLINSGILEDIDVLKVGHHGSNTSTTESFINKVLPEISIISVQYGRYNNMPSEDIINRLKYNDNQVYRTDIDGTIWLTSDGFTNTITLLKELNLNGANRVSLRVYYEYAILFIFKDFSSKFSRNFTLFNIFFIIECIYTIFKFYNFSFFNIRINFKSWNIIHYASSSILTNSKISFISI